MSFSSDDSVAYMSYLVEANAYRVLTNDYLVSLVESYLRCARARDFVMKMYGAVRMITQCPEVCTSHFGTHVRMRHLHGESLVDPWLNLVINRTPIKLSYETENDIGRYVTSTPVGNLNTEDFLMPLILSSRWMATMATPCK